MKLSVLQKCAKHTSFRGNLTCEAYFMFRKEHLIAKGLPKKSFRMVEMRRIELLSESLLPRFSTSVVIALQSLGVTPNNKLRALVVPDV